MSVGGVERTYLVLDNIKAERNRQDAKWGDQSAIRDGTGPNTLPLAFSLPINGKNYASSLSLLATERTDIEARNGGATMASILLEEIFEALAESDAEKLRVELVQVAAVAVAWCEYLDKRGAL